MTKPITRDPIYRRRRHPSDIIELCVRWYITYRLSYRERDGGIGARRSSLPLPGRRQTRQVRRVSTVLGSQRVRSPSLLQQGSDDTSASAAPQGEYRRQRGKSSGTAGFAGGGPRVAFRRDTQSPVSQQYRRARSSGDQEPVRTDACFQVLPHRGRYTRGC
jgi:hypothetical protein